MSESRMQGKKKEMQAAVGWCVFKIFTVADPVWYPDPTSGVHALRCILQMCGMDNKLSS